MGQIFITLNLLLWLVMLCSCELPIMYHQPKITAIAGVILAAISQYWFYKRKYEKKAAGLKVKNNLVCAIDIFTQKWKIIVPAIATVIALWIIVTFYTASRTVIVTDLSGKPIVGAEVSAQTHQIDGPWITTDSRGRARVSKSPKDIMLIRVKKSGYVESISGAIYWPVKVELIQTSRAHEYR